ncbi:hypothetical protein G7Y89_g14256 [Cudoniella acicularis]|uniref:2EXR domain-containing protein n=1 Tax=Cudoniella acicularis TaxID=354080 RepID=A0A8H4VWC5_9HELO|nr:hypothetical protein G7Y89_g14256 [Cudoniella acicularis]
MADKNQASMIPSEELSDISSRRGSLEPSEVTADTDQSQFSAETDSAESATKAELLQINRPRTFHPFPLLPNELQNMIWEMTLVPRVVDVFTRSESPDFGYGKDQDGQDEEGAPRWQWEISFHSSCAVPVALRVNRETRNAVINQYPKSFPSETAEPTIRFNFRLDTLFIDRNCGLTFFRLLNSLTSIEKSSLQRLAIAELAFTTVEQQTTDVNEDKWDILADAAEGEGLDQLTGLEDLMVAGNVQKGMGWGTDPEIDIEDIDDRDAEFLQTDGEVLLRDLYPPELMARPELIISRLPELGFGIPTHVDYFMEQWEDLDARGARLVWMWRKDEPRKKWVS